MPVLELPPRRTIASPLTGVGGIQKRSLFPSLNAPTNSGSGIAPAAPISDLMGDDNTYGAAVETQAGDYDAIMKSYQDLLSVPPSAGAPRTRMAFTPIAPQLAVYQRSPELANSMMQISNAAKTGGYEGDELSNIRARAISPIRSVYASAQRGLNRNRALQGGYSPNYAAATAKMAREQSEQIAQATTNVEAGIGESVSRNRLSALSALSPLAAQDSAAQNQFNLSNSETINRLNEHNRMAPLQYEQFNRENEQLDRENSDNDVMMRLRAIEGMRGLYGTTPALSSLYGSQNIQRRQLKAVEGQDAAQKEAEKKRLAIGLANMYGRRKG